MALILIFIFIIFIAIVLIPLMNVKGKGGIAIVAVFAGIIISSVFAVKTIGGYRFEYTFPGSLITGAIPVRIDALSGWFILTINFTFLTGAIYGFHYMKVYREQAADISLHAIAFILLYTALISICSLQNGLAFLFAWEIMALSAFILVIFEHQKRNTLKAGINYLIQSHISILFLTLAFIWVSAKTGSFDFNAIAEFSGTFSVFTSLVLFMCFFVGFAFKAGFVPFHTWLPHAHPAAPSHVSGIMSGVMIKIGIYGILRMILFIRGDYVIIGYTILAISVVSGVYGVMLAILQHNLKKLLAYHSVENIGIIGIGIGMGCIGLGYENQILTVLGFAGALLHTLNHSLFKSLLFFSAGNVFQATHTMQIEHLGGLGKRMPQTAFLFLIPALAICGLPPFNGFISEFLIYNGMFTCLKGAEGASLFMLVFSILGLTLIGGLAVLCFTKAFGMAFLGNPRTTLPRAPKEQKSGRLIAMYAIVLLIVAIGVFPQYVIQWLAEPVRLFTNYPGYGVSFMKFPFTDTLTRIGCYAIVFWALAGVIFITKKSVMLRKPKHVAATWGCGYVAPTPKLQYTASSFVRPYIKLAEPLLLIHKKKMDIEGVFPTEGALETHPDDKVEAWLIDRPLAGVKRFFNHFTFLQHGSPQVYVLYGMIFIALVLGIPLVYEAIKTVVQFFNHL